MSNPFANGQLVAAVAVLVDAIFGVLFATGTVHSKPDEGVVLSSVVVVFNLASFVLSYIQHSQHLAVTPKAASIPTPITIVPPLPPVPPVVP
jgi:hypothetical protein